MSKLPFQPLIDAMIKLGMDESEAIMRVQSRLDLFVNEKVQQTQKFDIESNETGRLSTSAQTTLATVLIPLVGLVFGQEKLLNSLSEVQKWTVLLILVLLFLSIVFGVISHWSSGKFFKKWASGSQAALKYANDQVGSMTSTKELYDKYDEKLVELGLINPEKTGTSSSTRLWDFLQLGFVLASGSMIVIILYSILFDVPWWHN